MVIFLLAENKITVPDYRTVISNSVEKEIPNFFLRNKYR